MPLKASKQKSKTASAALKKNRAEGERSKRAARSVSEACCSSVN
jgi:hypothetical protein